MVVQPEELPALLAAFATLFCMFFSYTILRPIRDTMGITSGCGKSALSVLGHLCRMLAVQPVYGWLTSRFRRPVFLPWVYAFFTANLLGFYLWFNLQQDHTWIARTYYVWVSVFNFFIVAVFWSLMADVFTREQAGRMFGFIAAGASTGGLLGPLVAGRLAVPLGTINLLLISAALLASSLFFMRRVIHWHQHFGSGARGAEVNTAARRPYAGGLSSSDSLALSARYRAVRDPALLGVDVSVSRTAGLRRQSLCDPR